ncbi:MAG TPA: PIN domain-containing protein [Pirellulaceae bacterium]|nr:PIN domain-containing protein [Pirellulaceae bacterium]
MRFVDTNILLYAISGDPGERDKSAVAVKLLEAPDLAMSVQVLQEFYVQATPPTRAQRISHVEAQALIESWLRFPVQEMTVDVLRAALETSSRFRLSYWDAAIIEAARVLKCSQVLSEDLSAGQSYAGIRVVNPFQRRRRPTGNR